MFGYERGVYPLRMGSYKDEDGCRNRMVIHLLLISDGKYQHYCWIKNMSRLISSQVNKRKGGRHFCLTCMNSFNTR